ncbi:hypothetical protein SAMN05216276_105532 [Streptosporangium subroseum]|uniref:Uncharacterized protein n=1 Tax=Streptosporangium subroseum TaxID=106412 RepID=A0A239NE67_9ACTN|nr:hypothetical protein SAMN05216276_105532 [Streptosporangium subroseum]
MPRRDFSPKAVQNLLLGLGGLLLVVAAIVFTVVSWGHIGIGGRAAILAGVTALTFAVPKLLVRRGLTTTAETIAMLGVALLFLDGYAARRVGLAGVDKLGGLDYTALLFALVALVLVGYARSLPLRLPLPVAIVLAQFPLPLLAFGETIPWVTAALAATAAADAAFLRFGARTTEPVAVTGGSDGDVSAAADGPGGGASAAGDGSSGDVSLTVGSGGDSSVAESGSAGDAPMAGSGAGGGVPVAGSGLGEGGSTAVPGGARPARRSGVWTTVAVCFGAVWALGVGSGVLDSSLRLMSSLFAGDLGADSVRGALLVVLAVIGLGIADRVEHTGRLVELTTGSMIALTVGLAVPFWPLLPYGGWWVVPHTAAALVAAAVVLYLPGLNDPRVRSAGAVSAGVLAVLTAIPSVPLVVLVLLNPFGRLDDVWSGTGGWEFMPFPAIPVVFGLLAVASVLAAGRGRARAGFAALATGTVAVAIVPVAYRWNHVTNLTILLVLAVVCVIGLTLARRPRWAGAFTVAAGAMSAVATATALTERTTTYAALATLLAAWGAAAFAARVPRAAAFALAVGVLSATGLIWAVAVGTGWLRSGSGLSLALAIGAVTAGLLALRGRPAARSGDARPSEGAAARSGGALPSGGATVRPEGALSSEGAAAGSGGELPAGGIAVRPGGVRPGGIAGPWQPTGLVLGAVLAAFALLVARAAVAEIFTFYGPLARPWTPLGGSHGPYPLLIVILGLVAVAAVLISWQLAGRKGALRTGLVAWPLLPAILPISFALPYGLEVGLFVAGLCPTAWIAARSRTNWGFGGAAALLTASMAVSWALMSRPATLIVLPIAAVVAGAVAFRGRARAVTVGGAGLATLLVGGEVLAAGLAMDWPVRHAAFGALAVACAAAAVAGRFRSSAFAIGVETAGYALATAGLLLGVADLPLAGLACAVVGVLMAGTALRPDRQWAGYVGTGFLLTASWLRLLASDITVIEAYTVPFSLVLLAFGWWKSRNRQVSSWIAYGSGLASSLAPSMIAMLAGGGWLRPLALGTVSLAVLLSGARFRLQAPALLGGFTLAVVALHELAPWIAQAVVAVPRWVPMAFGGLLLVVVGATYEARLGDVRRLRAAVGRMR